VMEGKGVLFKKFAGIDVFDLEINEKDDLDKLVDIIASLEPTFGGINLEDIKAPDCFYVERKLRERMKIPVFHDDQHGTAIVVLAASINALKVTGKKKEDCKIVVNGAGAAGVAISKLLLKYGFGSVTLCDSRGIVSADRTDLNDTKKEMLKITNPENRSGKLADAVVGTDIFVGVSAPGVLTQDMIKTMNADPIIFAMANPVPEIIPDEAKAAGARIVGTGRSDFPNQINNVVAFPGIFRGALEARAPQITEEMKLAAAEAIAAAVPADKLCEDYIMPEAFDTNVRDSVAEAVKRLVK